MSSTRNQRVHILGIGNLGALFANALARLPNPPPITLLLHRESLVGEWERVGRKLEITTNGVQDSSGTFDVELIGKVGETAAIENLLVATKANRTLEALTPIQERLTKDSTVVFTQNGMGIVDEVTALFKSPASIPHYLAAITSHGVYSQGPFRSVHAGQANVTIAPVFATSQTPSPSPESRYLLDLITSAPVLNAQEVSPMELTYLQLEKLAMNAILNPLTALYRCKNGEWLSYTHNVTLMRNLLKEISTVFRSLPDVLARIESPAELQEFEERFSASELEKRVLAIAENTAANKSSMLQDVLAKRETEVSYINGWIVKRGLELGLDLMVRGNQSLVGLLREVPLTRSFSVSDEKAMERELGFE